VTRNQIAEISGVPNPASPAVTKNVFAATICRMRKTYAPPMVKAR
jgi:hypothetical protein